MYAQQQQPTTTNNVHGDQGCRGKVVLTLFLFWLKGKKQQQRSAVERETKNYRRLFGRCTHARQHIIIYPSCVSVSLSLFSSFSFSLSLSVCLVFISNS
jgi:ABC-type multidrug transport system permease subunit